MKRLLAMLSLVCLLCGCGGQVDGSDGILTLRKQLELGEGSEFDAVITADYSEKMYTFGMNCRTDQQGNLYFTVVQPQSIAQISGSVSEVGGKLSFEDNALAFELLADGMISPVCAPWILIRSLRGGYIHGCSQDEEMTCTQLDDSFRGKNLQVWVWTDGNDRPVSAEIMYDGRRILSLTVENFNIV